MISSCGNDRFNTEPKYTILERTCLDNGNIIPNYQCKFLYKSNDGTYRMFTDSCNKHQIGDTIKFCK